MAEIEQDCIVVSDKFDIYSPSDRQRRSKERVQHWLDRGRMTQDALYQRYTEKLTYTVTATCGSDMPAENTKLTFRQLRDPGGTYLSPDRFESMITQKFSGAAFADGATTLYEIFKCHAFFPFPSGTTAFGTPCIDEDAFLRATFLLTRDPPPYLSPNFSCPNFSSVHHNTSSGYWGPHYGRVISLRGRDAVDFSRRIFRGLAVPNDVITDHETMIKVPRFTMYLPRSESDHRDSDSEEDLGQEIIVVEHERERSLDVHDVASESAEGWDDRMTANPLREAYKLVLPSLAAQPYDLANLHVPTAKLLSLLSVLQAIELPDNPGGQEVLLEVIVSVEALDSHGKIDWEVFKSVITEHGELIADCMSIIFEIFKNPIDMRT